MPEVIACPKCDRKLRVPEAVLGQLVQCPSCQHSWIAQPPSLEPPPPSVPRPPQVIPVEVDQPPPPGPPGRGGWFDEARKRRESRDRGENPGELDFGDAEGPARPHRGSSILLLSILGIVFTCVPVLGAILGIIAVSMASSDLQDMARRRMDRDGRSLTQAGQICGVIAIVASILWTFFACLTGGFRRW